MFWCHVASVVCFISVGVSNMMRLKLCKCLVCTASRYLEACERCLHQAILEDEVVDRSGEEKYGL